MSEGGEVLSAQEVLEKVKDEFGEKILESQIKERTLGLKKKTVQELWMLVEKDAIRDVLIFLSKIHYMHESITSPVHFPEEKYVLFNYHFTMFWGHPHKEISVIVRTKLPEDDLRLTSMTDVFPGILTTEREEKEMMGITFEGIPDSRHMFLPQNFPEDVHPWRKDKGMKEKVEKAFKKSFAEVPDDDVENKEGST